MAVWRVQELDAAPVLITTPQEDDSEDSSDDEPEPTMEELIERHPGIDNLMAMGFAAASCVRAMGETYNNVQRAADWLIEHMQEESGRLEALDQARRQRAKRRAEREERRKARAAARQAEAERLREVERELQRATTASAGAGRGGEGVEADGGSGDGAGVAEVAEGALFGSLPSDCVVPLASMHPRDRPLAKTPTTGDSLVVCLLGHLVRLCTVYEPLKGDSADGAVSLLTSTQTSVLPLEEPFCLQVCADTFLTLHALLERLAADAMRDDAGATAAVGGAGAGAGAGADDAADGSHD